MCFQYPKSRALGISAFDSAGLTDAGCEARAKGPKGVWGLLWSCCSPTAQRAPSVSSRKQRHTVLLIWKALPLIRGFTISARQREGKEGKGMGTMAIAVPLQVDCTLLSACDPHENHSGQIVPEGLLCARVLLFLLPPRNSLQEESVPERFSLPMKPSPDRKEGKMKVRN